LFTHYFKWEGKDIKKLIELQLILEKDHLVYADKRRAKMGAKKPVEAEA